jgi:hypothetical protein
MASSSTFADDELPEIPEMFDGHTIISTQSAMSGAGGPEPTIHEKTSSTPSPTTEPGKVKMGDDLEKYGIEELISTIESIPYKIPEGKKYKWMLEISKLPIKVKLDIIAALG